MSRMKEFRFIEIASRIFERRKREVIAGAGDDDCAVIKIGDQYLILTTDNLHEKADFPESMSPYEMGHMAVAVNFSDLAGTGAKPEYFLFDITIREGIDEGFFVQILKGIEDLAKKYDAEVVGGDIDFGDELYITGFAAGIARKPALQSGARTGDRVYITGVTGKAELSLEQLFSGKKREEIPFISSLFTPEPKIWEGIEISEYASAMTDISDSLAISLHNISRKSGVKIVLKEEYFPLTELTELVSYDRALELFLYGGGDFELVFTSEESDRGIMIGEVMDGSGVFIEKRSGIEEVDFRGYSHF